MTATLITRQQLEAGLDHIRRSPGHEGTVELIVRRPGVDVREVLDVARLEIGEGLVGDTWQDRPSRSTPDRSPNPEMQLTVMNARAIALIARDPARRPLAGDQLYVDLDLSVDNLPPGTVLAIGDAAIRVTETPHLGCKKFSSRFGLDALRLVNSEVGRRLRLRGLNARVVEPGTIGTGDTVRKISA